MKLFRKKISKDEFIELMLELRYEIEKSSTLYFKEELDCHENEKRLKFEIMIFSLWIVTTLMPSGKAEMKDLLHDKFSEKHWGQIAKSLFEEIDKRYTQYYKAFEMWQQNPQNGHMIGSVMIEMIKKHNTDFSLYDRFPLSDGNDCLKAFILWGKLVEHSSSVIEEIKRRYNLKDIL